MKKNIIYILKQGFLFYSLFGVIFGVVYFLNNIFPLQDINLWINSRISFLISFASVIFVKFCVRAIRKGKVVEKDERTLKISYYSLAFSWNIALLTACSIILLSSFEWLNLSWQQISILFFLELVLTWVWLQFYFTKKWSINI